MFNTKEDVILASISAIAFPFAVIKAAAVTALVGGFGGVIVTGAAIETVLKYDPVEAAYQKQKKKELSDKRNQKIADEFNYRWSEYHITKQLKDETP